MTNCTTCDGAGNIPGWEPHLEFGRNSWSEFGHYTWIPTTIPCTNPNCVDGRDTTWTHKTLIEYRHDYDNAPPLTTILHPTTRHVAQKNEAGQWFEAGCSDPFDQGSYNDWNGADIITWGTTHTPDPWNDEDEDVAA